MRNIRLQDLEAARAALPAPVRRTPVVPLSRDSAEIGRQCCFLKLENLQVADSYKFRASFTMLNALPEQTATKVLGITIPNSILLRVDKVIE